ncbi:MAG: hypothetical protein NZ888_04130 [Candidatus Nitrosocaldus sp.]|nr:hypothetical protein [Candidatus Nitrosocaldus sp.]MDW8000989.1 hypothetical protein [Candidatus Nitrosocaldus sp.]
MQSKAILAIMALGSLLVVGMIANGNKAHAAASVTAVGSPYVLGETGLFQLCANTTMNIDLIALVRPDGTTAFSSVVSPMVTIPGGGCVTIDPATYGFTGFDMVGDWWVFAANAAGGNPFLFEFQVTFQVVPEFILGAITAVTAPLAAFAGFKVLRSRSK